MPQPLSEALLSFSLLINISKLCSLNVGADTLAPIHGLKFYTMLWIILVHTCLLANEVSGTCNDTCEDNQSMLLRALVVIYLYFCCRQQNVSKRSGKQLSLSEHRQWYIFRRHIFLHQVRLIIYCTISYLLHVEW